MPRASWPVSRSGDGPAACPQSAGPRGRSGLALLGAPGSGRQPQPTGSRPGQWPGIGPIAAFSRGGRPWLAGLRRPNPLRALSRCRPCPGRDHRGRRGASGGRRAGGAGLIRLGLPGLAGQDGPAVAADDSGSGRSDPPPEQRVGAQAARLISRLEAVRPEWRRQRHDHRAEPAATALARIPPGDGV